MVSSVKVDRREGVALITLANPPSGLMDPAMEQGLLKAVRSLEADESVRALVLTGETPGIFVTHYDVAVLAERAAAMRARGMSFAEARPVREGPIHETQRRLEAMPKATIAAINGTAMGGGFELALACDFRLAADGDYPLGLPEINLGLLPGAGGTQRLTRLVGVARALELTLLGDTIAPARAHALGLLTELTQGPPLPRALELAGRLAAKPQRALAHIKNLVRRAPEGPLDQLLAAERTLFCDLLVQETAAGRMAEWVAGRRDIRTQD